MRQEITTILTIFNESDVIKCDTNGDDTGFCMRMSME